MSQSLSSTDTSQTSASRTWTASPSGSKLNNVNEGSAVASIPKNVNAVTQVYDNWGLLKWIRPSTPLKFSSTKKTYFVVLEHDATTLIIYNKNACRLFNGKTIQDKCLALFPIHGATVYDRIDLDSVSKSCFYFVIKDITGNPVDFVVLVARTVGERDRWVQKLRNIGCASRNVSIFQRQNEDLRSKLNNASNLLKIDIGEKLISNLITGKYDDSQKYRDLKEHLNEFITIWEQVWHNKRVVHAQLLNTSQKHNHARIIHAPYTPEASAVSQKKDNTVVGRRRPVQVSFEEKTPTSSTEIESSEQLSSESESDATEPDTYDLPQAYPRIQKLLLDSDKDDNPDLKDEGPGVLMLNKVIRGMDHVRKQSIMQSRINELHLDSTSDEYF